VKVFLPLSEDLEASLRYFDSLQSICSIDDITIIKPGREDVPRFVDAIDRVAIMAEQDTGAAVNQRLAP
jgi:hypothetical protein